MNLSFRWPSNVRRRPSAVSETQIHTLDYVILRLLQVSFLEVRGHVTVCVCYNLLAVRRHNTICICGSVRSLRSRSAREEERRCWDVYLRTASCLHLLNLSVISYYWMVHQMGPLNLEFLSQRPQRHWQSLMDLPSSSAPCRTGGWFLFEGYLLTELLNCRDASSTFTVKSEFFFTGAWNEQATPPATPSLHFLPEKHQLAGGDSRPGVRGQGLSSRGSYSWSVHPIKHGKTNKQTEWLHLIPPTN